MFNTGTYCSSKAALTHLSETSRLELAPLGVSVVTLLVGTIKTPFYANQPSFELPQSSRYLAIKSTIARWATGEASPKGSPPDEFAESIVDDVVGAKRDGLVWKGPNSFAVWFVTRWLPQFILVSILRSGIEP